MVTKATDDSFSQDVQEGNVFVKFGAEWCGPCKQMEPILADLQTEYDGRVKFVAVDIDSTTIASKFNIRGVPTILLFKNGEVVNTLVGGQTKGRLTLAIDTAFGFV